MHNYKKPIFILLTITVLVLITFYYTKDKLPPRLVLTKTAFTQLPQWDQDDHAQALIAFQRSCKSIMQRKPNAPYSALPQFGTVKDWQAICITASQLKKPDITTARQFFENTFEPYLVKNYFNSQGLFTGYYLPLLHASFKKDTQYSYPIYGLPKDLVRINISEFFPHLPNKTLVAQLKNNRLSPLPDRSQITKEGINAPVILWTNNVVEIFFAQIQGSAQVRLPDGKTVLISYASNNGHPYTPIGRTLIQKKLLSKEKISMQTIKAWLYEHPDQIEDILNHNASYVFFNLLTTEGPIGTQQVPLTPQRSLAIDTRYLPLGAPIWLSTQVPSRSPGETSSYQHLLIAQDTGGEIKGIVRGDIYWGAGEHAEWMAGHMKNTGKYWVLLPRERIN